MLRPTHLPAAAAVTLLGLSASAQISFQPATSIPLLGQRPAWVASGDFDGDGDADLAVTTGQPQGVNGPERVELFVNNGLGGFSAGQVVVLGNNVGAAGLVAADLDNDGDLDLAASLHQTNAVQVLRNSGGVFALAGAAVGVGGSEPRNMAAGDVDNDGDVDLVTSNRGSDNLSVLLNNGSGAFASGGTLVVGQRPAHVALADLNGDCDLDIALAAQDSRRAEVLFGSGTGAFGAPVGVAIPGNDKPSGMAAADLDGDGDVDLATTLDDNGVGRVCVITNLGGSFSAAVFASNGQNPGAILAADLDADGDKDLATADEDSNLVSALPRTLGTSYGAASTFAVGSFPTSLAGADLDGNGSIDLVTANRDSNSLSVLRNATAGGTESYCTALPNSVGAGARIDSSGALSIAANAFTLNVRCAPPARNGLFFYGATPTNVPYGGGRMCVLPPVARLGPLAQTDAAGRMVRLLDFNQPPTNSGPTHITAGSTWYFQFWYRDPVGTSNTNTSDGLKATFRP